MSNLGVIIIYVSMVDSLIREFKYNESNHAINDIKKQARRFMKEKYKKNNKTFIEATKSAHIAFENSIGHFVDEKYEIDIYSLICELWNDKEDLFKRYTNLSHKRIEKLLLSAPDTHTVKSELQAKEVGSFIIGEITKQTRLIND